jgi:hypothetical protein
MANMTKGAHMCSAIIMQIIRLSENVTEICSLTVSISSGHSYQMFERDGMETWIKNFGQ